MPFVSFVVNLPLPAMSSVTTPTHAPDPTREHHLFWMLVTKAHRRDDVARAYLAIQAALAYRQETVDVDWLTGAMMPAGRRSPDPASDPLGAGGLAYFHWLFEVELLTPGEADCHQYRFCRRNDHAQITVHLRTAPFPRSLQFQQEYERQRRKLETRRALFLTDYRPVDS